MTGPGGEQNMNADGAYVIVGASLAGAKAAESLRQEGSMARSP
jgi:hypothetical protein